MKKINTYKSNLWVRKSCCVWKSEEEFVRSKQILIGKSEKAKKAHVPYTRVTHDMDDFDDVQKKHTKWVSIRDTIRDTSRYDTIYVFADKKRAHTKKQNMKN